MALIDCCNDASLGGQGCIAESSPGISEAYFINYKDFTSLPTNTCDEIIDIVLCPYKCIYNIQFNQETADFGSTTPREAGVYKSTLFFEFNTVENTCETVQWIKGAMGAKHVMIILDSAGNWWMGGTVNGMYLINSDRQSGKTFDDSSQTTLRFEGREGGITGGWKVLLAGTKGVDSNEVRKVLTRDLVNTNLCDQPAESCGCSTGE